MDLSAVLGTKGSGSPINLTGSPVSSASNPVVTTSTGPIVFGGGPFSSTSGSAGLPTPSNVFGQQGATGIFGNPALLLAAGLFFFVAWRHR